MTGVRTILMIDLENLTRDLNNDEISEVLGQLVQDGLSVDRVLLVLRQIVVVYPSLNETNKRVVRKLCSGSIVFISQLVQFIKVLGNKSEANIYKGFLLDTLRREPGGLCSMMEVAKPMEQRQVGSMLFGSKIFNVLGGVTNVLEYLEILGCQVKYWLEHNENWSNKANADMFLMLFQFHPTHAMDIILGGVILQGGRTWEPFVQICNTNIGVSQKRLVNGYLLKYLDRVTNESTVQQCFNLLCSLDYRLIDLLKVHELQSIYLKYAIAKALSLEGRLNLLNILLSAFSAADENFDQQICELLLILLQTLNKEHFQQLVHDETFLNAVTKRLSSEFEVLRERTMFIAKIIAGDDLKYESKYNIAVPTLELTRTTSIQFDLLNHRPEERDAMISNTIDRSITKLSLNDSDDEDEDNPEDPATRHIVFLKELVQEFELLSSTHRSSIKLLKTTVKLVRQKKDFTSEVSFYFSPLINAIATLSNTMDHESFEEWRINALVSLLVVVPDKVVDLFLILFQGDLSFQQRMSILSSLALSARELRGFDDPYILKPEYDFPSNRLPWDNPKAQLTDQTTLIQDVSEDKSSISDGQVIWKSKKLSTDQTSNKKKPNNFRKVASIYFFPLANAWMNGIDLGTFDSLFKTHYLSTLKIIFSAANPHHKYQEMSSMLNMILEDAASQNIEV
ncbi:Tel2p Ecym_4418 [Eremothecium cymbalariae DBVPG|uniref:Telomere length regulation protein conserved domain-containing protein n=1 Tax=Eremothecium cymbalariae (strain CBS 270.75 / DBVPG 7215 / KCTC 17166 / NRRL Y-17582) TaxID=931890 RepID=G8JTW5_ERECY|nr:hypothetical protein Ecym_4418 [Eremothecium cymbalariae DBVPG\